MANLLKKIVKLFFIGLGLVTGILFTVILVTGYFNHTVNIFDIPRHLSNKTQTIDVYYIDWACDCADFIETKYYEKNSNYELDEKDCIFIEASKNELRVPETFYTKDHYKRKLRLTGRFYKDKGISATYELKTSLKPEKAKVFRYEKIRIMNK